MLARVVVLCLLVALASAAHQTRELWGKHELMSTFNHETDVTLKLQALKVQKFLSSLPAQCALTHWSQVQDAQEKALKTYHSCNVKVILKTLAEFLLDTGEFALSVYGLGTNIFAEVVACLNPADWLYCILSAPKDIIADVKGLVAVTENYYSEIKTVIPNVLKDINACFHKTSTDYQQLLDGIVHVAKQCDADFGH